MENRLVVQAADKILKLPAHQRKISVLFAPVLPDFIERNISVSHIVILHAADQVHFEIDKILISQLFAQPADRRRRGIAQFRQIIDAGVIDLFQISEDMLDCVTV